MIIRRVVSAAALWMVAGMAMAQANWREVAVPVYTLDAYSHGSALANDERASRLAQASHGLTVQLAAACAASTIDAPAVQAIQAQWRASVSAWDALSALTTGPLIEHRSARSIDFMPVRTEMLSRAVDSHPTSLADMERIGAPARGFSALESLLWKSPAFTAGSAECAYATMLAADIEREARALAADYAKARGTPLEDEAALSDLVETVNQWLGGVEQLRWAFMRKPLDAAASRGAAPEYPRQLSGQTAAIWRARWATLRDTAVLGPRAVPVPGEAPVPFETLLRGRGLNPLADRLVAATTQADGLLQGLQPTAIDRVRDAAAALGELAKLAQDDLAPALGVRLGFSDADGD